MNVTQEYKQTEFGPIPSDWILCTFQDVLVTFSSGATPYRGIPEYYKGNVRWISSGELNYNKIFDTVEHISQQAVRNTNLRVHQPGTFLMAITGLEAEGTRGRCAFVGAPATTNQSCLAINGTEKMCTEYLFWFYRMWGQYLAFKYCQGTKQQSYTASIVRNLPIYGPKDIAEQRAIAEALSDIDGLNAALDKKIAKKRLIKQGAMQQLLTGKKRLPGFTDPWVEKRLGEIGVWVKGQSLSKNDIIPNGKNICIHYGELFSYGEVITLPVSRTNCQPTTISLGNEILFPDSDVTPDGLGRCSALLIKGVIIGSGINVLRHKPLYDTSFVSYSININRSKIIDRVTGTTVKHINSKELSEIMINIPKNKEEQTAIATILSDMDKEIADLEAKRDKYRLLKSGMMQKLLTGQIRLQTK